jgi:hypothetical protein
VYDKVEKKEKKASFVATKLVFLPPPFGGLQPCFRQGQPSAQNKF